MKKAITAIALTALVMSGCSAAPAAVSSTAPAASQPSVATASVQGQPSPAGEVPKGERFGKAVRGKIQDILGNEVTLAVAEAPQRPEGADGAAPKKTTAAMPGADAGGGPPAGFQRRATEMKLTGEVFKLQIPVGVPIVARSQGEERSLELSDLAKGDILVVGYDSDEETIINVTVMSGGAQ